MEMMFSNALAGRIVGRTVVFIARDRRNPMQAKFAITAGRPVLALGELGRKRLGDSRNLANG
jgi:hypothetical protein